MNVSFTIDTGWLARPDELARRLAVAVELSRPPGQASPPEKPRISREPGDDDEPIAPGTERYAALAAGPTVPRTGPELLAWIDRQPAKQAVLKRAQSIGKSRSWSWQIKGWAPSQVQDVWHELTSKPAPERGAKRP